MGHGSGGDAPPARGSRPGRKQAAWLLALPLSALLLAALLLGQPRTARPAPLVANGAVAPGLASGIYLGWSDGNSSRLLLHGAGCREAATGDSVASLTFMGPTDTLTVGSSGVSEILADVDFRELQPLIEVELPPVEPTIFDRAVLRCRSGVESTARMSLRLERIAAPQPQADGAGLTLFGPSYAPAVGLMEFTLLNGDRPVRLTSFEYAGADVSTGLIRAAAGHRESVALWRGLVHGPGHNRPGPDEVTPWDAAYQSPADARYLRERRADALDLEIGPYEAAFLVVDGRSFRTTATRLPLVLFPLVRYESARGAGVLAAREPAFGWSSQLR